MIAFDCTTCIHHQSTQLLLAKDLFRFDLGSSEALNTKSVLVSARLANYVIHHLFIDIVNFRLSAISWCFPYFYSEVSGDHLAECKYPSRQMRVASPLELCYCYLSMSKNSVSSFVLGWEIE